jgi:hypothetical protein
LTKHSCSKENLPGVLPVFLVNTYPDDGLDDGLAGQDGAALFSVHRVLHPVVNVVKLSFLRHQRCFKSYSLFLASLQWQQRFKKQIQYLSPSVYHIAYPTEWST